MQSQASMALRSGLNQPDSGSRSRQALAWSARIWFGALAGGQLLFVLYLLAFYWRHAFAGQLAAWNKVVPHAYRAGDGPGNAAMVIHIAMATLVIAGGLLQLLPWLRTRLPQLHRWNGRLYMLGALAASAAGLYMVWIRGAVGDMSQHIGLTLDAVLIWAFAWLSWRAAWQGRIADHRRWALRLFIAVSGVWFFRVGMMLWIVINHGPKGFDPDSFTGPFLTFLAFADYLLPLAILELYLRAQHARPATRLTIATLIGGLSIAMLIGTAVAALAMWLPRMAA
ncbi:DUF2306 domain-containing protein [Chitinimonas sp.]|uniref:DUF2306 domain-containing protein n=1 Tax=Chitinimonas sp. TaxID=1934313 RepID=UPI0035B36498